MKKTILALAILAAAAAHATTGGEPHHTGCDGKGNANSPCAGTGGQGGAGGAGGSATAAAGAKASARAAAIAAQAQRQTLNSTITNTVNAAPVRVRISLAAPAAPSPAAPEKTATEQPLKEAAPLVVPEAAREARPVSTAYAPNINPTSPCALTISGGIQARELGISFGGTPIAEFCKQLEIARAAYNMQDKATAEEIMCAEETYRAARRRAKRPCTQDLEASAERAAAILEDRHTRAYVTAKDDLGLLP